MKKSVLIIIITFCFLSNAQKTITVVDLNVFPVANAYIYEDSKLVQKTDSSGNAVLSKIYNNKTLNITKFGFKDYEFIPKKKDTVFLLSRDYIILDEVELKPNDNYKDVISEILNYLKTTEKSYHKSLHSNKILVNSSNDTLYFFDEKYRMESGKLHLNRQNKIFNKILFLSNGSNNIMPFVKNNNDTISIPFELADSSNPESMIYRSSIFNPLKNSKDYKWDLHQQDSVLILKYEPKKTSKFILTYRGELIVDKYDYRIYKYQMDAYKPDKYKFNSRDFDGQPNAYEFYCNNVSKTYIYGYSFGEYKMVYEQVKAIFTSKNPKTDEEKTWTSFRGVEYVNDFKIIDGIELHPTYIGTIKNLEESDLD